MVLSSIFMGRSDSKSRKFSYKVFSGFLLSPCILLILDSFEAIGGNPSPPPRVESSIILAVALLTRCQHQRWGPKQWWITLVKNRG